MRENKNTEFKREYVDEIKKTIVAFANTDGGTLYIGINDDGTVSGIEDILLLFCLGSIIFVVFLRQLQQKCSSSK